MNATTYHLVKAASFIRGMQAAGRVLGKNFKGWTPRTGYNELLTALRDKLPAGAIKDWTTKHPRWFGTGVAGTAVGGAYATGKGINALLSSPEEKTPQGINPWLVGAGAAGALGLGALLTR